MLICPLMLQHLFFMSCVMRRRRVQDFWMETCNKIQDTRVVLLDNMSLPLAMGGSGLSVLFSSVAHTPD